MVIIASEKQVCLAVTRVDCFSRKLYCSPYVTQWLQGVSQVDVTMAVLATNIRLRQQSSRIACAGKIVLFCL